MTQQALPFGDIDTAVDRFDGLRVADLTAAEKESVVSLALAVLAAKHRLGTALTSPEATRAYLRLEMGDRHNELFGVLFLDNQHRIIAKEEMFYGTIDGASVHPRVVVQRALALNCAAVVIAHSVPRNKMRLLCPVSLCAKNGRSLRQSRTADRHQGT